MITWKHVVLVPALLLTLFVASSGDCQTTTAGNAIVNGTAK